MIQGGEVLWINVSLITNLLFFMWSSPLTMQGEWKTDAVCVCFPQITSLYNMCVGERWQVRMEVYICGSFHYNLCDYEPR